MAQGRRNTGHTQELREALSKMKPGQSFAWGEDNTRPYNVAKAMKLEIVTKKRNEGGWRVWLVGPAKKRAL